jgi:hypothetical protein
MLNRPELRRSRTALVVFAPFPEIRRGNAIYTKLTRSVMVVRV